MSKLWKLLIMWICNHIFCATHFFQIKRKLLNSCKGITIGEGTCIVTPMRIPLVSELYIGKGCWINRDFTIEGNGKVYIGDNCALAPTVTMVTGSHLIGDSSKRAGEGFCGSIFVGDGCWLCNKSSILANCKIGNGTVIAAGAVVTKDIPSNVLAGGVPSRVLKTL